jgi:polysaccharide pyruvyl transferase WcaK-like protein
MKIGIWGNYNYGNFGDDLMAISISKYLINKGHHPIVYRLNKGLSQQFDIQTEDNIDELISKIDFCLIGGGGMLVGNSWIKRQLSIVAKKFENDFNELLDALTYYNVPIYSVSIGGGANAIAKFSNHRKQFYKSNLLKKGTVRLEGDLSLIKKYNENFIYYPDILLDTKNQFVIADEEKKSKDEIRIGLNLIKKDLKKQKWHLQLLEKAKTNKNLKLFFIKTHLPEYNIGYEYIPERLNDNNIKIYQYANLVEMLDFLNSLDLIISSKLHVGLVSLSLGVPFFSYKGREKTKAFLMTVEGKHLIINTKDEIESLINEKIYLNKKDNLNILNLNLLQKMITESKQHYTFINHIIEIYKEDR